LTDHAEEHLHNMTAAAETEVKSSVRESLAARQQSDPELGKLVRLRLLSAEQPALAHLSTESENANRLYNEWERSEVQEGLVRRRVEGKPGEQLYSQLLVPHQSVQDVLHCCHEGMTGGHFGIRRTLDLVKRRFYWLTWKEDTIRFCKRCEPCNEYHRGKLRRIGPLGLQPVIAGAPYERWYIDLTRPHPRSERGNTTYARPVWMLLPSGQKRFHSAPRKLSQSLKCSSSKSFVVLALQYLY